MKRTVLISLMAGLWAAQTTTCVWAAPETAVQQETAQENAWDYQTATNTWRYYGKDRKPVTGGSCRRKHLFF